MGDHAVCWLGLPGHLCNMCRIVVRVAKVGILSRKTIDMGHGKKATRRGFPDATPPPRYATSPRQILRANHMYVLVIGSRIAHNDLHYTTFVTGEAEN